MKRRTIPEAEKSETSLVQNEGRLLLLVGIIGAVLGCFLWGIGQPRVALGTVLATPVAMFNHWFLAKVLARRGTVETSEVMIRTLVRTAIACGGLLIGLQFGIDVMLGVLLGLNVEVLTYFGEALWAILRRGSA